VRSCALLLLLVPTLALAQPEYLPLQDGNNWQYATEAGDTWITTVDGTLEVLGNPAFRLVQVLAGADAQSLENWWSIDGEGNVFLHGFDNAGFVREYEPPVLFVDAPLFLGKTWASSTQAGSDLIDLEFTVETDGLVDLPVGSLPAFGISYLQPLEVPKTPGYSLAGHRLPAGKRDPADATDWYSDGVGPVQLRFGGNVYQLTAYSIGTVATQASSFGAVKALYRD